MKSQKLVVSLLLATLIGAVHTYLLVWAWVYIGLNTPLPHWLITHGITGAPFKSILFPTDFLINMMLCFPAAYLLCKLRSAKLWALLIVALLPGLLWQYQLVFVDITLFRNWLAFLPGVLLAALPLPATTLIVRQLVGDGPNNSLEPNALRSTSHMAG